MRFGITHKLALAFTAFAALALISTASTTYLIAHSALEDAVTVELFGAAIEKESAVRDWIADALGELSGMAKSPSMIADAELAIAMAEGGDGRAVQVKLAKTLKDRAASEADFALMYFVADGGNWVVTSSGASNDPRDQAIAALPLAGISTPRVVTAHDPTVGSAFGTLVIAVPVRTAEGRSLGSLVAWLNAGEVAKILRQRPGLRATDDAYLISSDEDLVVPPRSAAESSPMGRRFSHQALIRCRREAAGLHWGDDYRGIATVAVHRWMPSPGLCLVTKLDRSEVLAPVGSMKKFFVLAGLAALFIVIVTATLLARFITQPIVAMADGVARIERGFRKTRFPDSRQDEIGVLGRNLNQMMEALVDKETQILAHSAILERRVADKTSELSRRAEELARSNQELERFAYIASHDLQEPLRMVSSYTQLLAKRYQGKLDAAADEFIAFAVDGATRMQGLINDLLAYSRVGTNGQPLRSVDCHGAVERALTNLKFALQESGAVVECGVLPRIQGDLGQLTQLFQNLIGNAIKFRGDRRPKVAIAADWNGREWTVSIRDNGIGIDPRYVDQLFTIFKRLHTRAEYPGTGIGLAICKRIVERHGGRIWIDSLPGRGSTFNFTLPPGDASEQRDTDAIGHDTPGSTASDGMIPKTGKRAA